MLRRILSILLFLVASGAAAPAIHFLQKYFVDEGFRDRMLDVHGYGEDGWAALFFAVGGGQALVFLLGYLLTLDSQARRRPWEWLVIGSLGVGATLGAAGSTFASLDFTSTAYTMAAAGAVGAALVVVAAEFALRWTSQAVVRKLDQRNMGGAALTAGRLALLWRPGEEALLRSVMIERYNRGTRGDLPDRLRALHAAGDRSPDLLEVLCQVANEQKRPEEFVGYLRDLLAQHPDDKELQQALLAELLEQGREAEALAHIARHGPPRDLEGTTAHGDLLVKAGRLDEAVEVAKRLATMEGIPFRRSDALLRRILSEDEANLPAVNALAEQAVRLARRDQLARWLMRSFEIDPSQTDVRERLVEMLEEQGQTQPLEQVLRAAALDRPKDAGVVLRYTAILLTNGKNAEALEELAKLEGPACKEPEYLTQRATALFEVGEHEEAKSAAEAALKTSLPEERAAAMRDLLRRVEEAQLTAELAERVALARQQPDNVDLQLDVLARLMDRHVDRAVVHADELARRRPDTRAEIKKIIRRHMAGREQGGYPLLNFLADLQVGDGEFDEALETVLQMAGRALDTFSALRDGTQKILRRSPHHLRTLRTMGEMYHDLGQFTEMIHAYSLYLGNGGEGTERINQAMANAYLALGDFENARKFVVELVGRPLPAEAEEAAEAMREENRQYLLKLIPLGLDKGRAPDSAELMKHLEMLAAGRKEVRVLRKQVEEALGEQRLSFLKRELESGKGDKNTLEEIGDLCREAEDFNQAITYYQRAARQAGSTRVPIAKLAYCFARKRLFDTAGETMAELTLSLQDDPQELEALMVWIYRTGEVFEEARFFERSLRIFKQLMKVDAGYKDVLERVERLSAK